MPSASIKTTCCIAGGGPAGMMLGFLLARAGVRVTVLEKHADFLRDFRGDTIHPSTLELMYELGLLEEFLKLPHSKVRRLSGQVGDARITIADFSHLPTLCQFIALMPQSAGLRASRHFHCSRRAIASCVKGRGRRVSVSSITKVARPVAAHS